MKHLLNGVAIAAVLAIAAPGWAQAASTMSNSPAMSNHKSATMAPKKRHRTMRHARMRHRSMRSNDNIANELNRQELQRIENQMPPPPPKNERAEKPRGG